MRGGTQGGGQPFLRWAGSKRQIVPFLREYWSGSFNTYVEPFCGSACFFFNLVPGRAVLGDINEELVSAYREIAIDAPLVVQALRRLPTGKRAYYEVRSKKPQELSCVEAAARFVYLNHHCFNGLYRTNVAGDFNVPLGRPKKPRSLDEQAIIDAGEALRSATLVNADFVETLQHVERNDFVYLDPPYVTSRDKTFREYGPKLFSTTDLERLSGELDRIHKKKAFFVVSYLDTALARRTFKKWRLRTVYARRNIAGFAGSRREAREILATNISL